MGKKIGFNSYDNEDEEKKEEEKKRPDKSQLIADFLSASYSPDGLTEDKIYKTSEELAYDLQETIVVSASDISKAMTVAGYNMQFFEGKPYWELYEKNLIMY